MSAALTFDFRDFERAAERMQAAQEQIPFALSQAMNDGLAAAREQIVERTWPAHMTVRNQRFLGVALRREFASKRKLRVSLFDNIGRGNLLLHEQGGTRRPRGASIAVPTDRLKGKRTGKGVPKGLRPGALGATAFKKGDALYRRVGTYQKGSPGEPGTDNRRLELLYVLKPSTQIKAEVPFEADFDRAMITEVWRSFRPRLMTAMAGRRK